MHAPDSLPAPAPGSTPPRTRVLHRSASLEVIDYRCSARPGDPSFDECHAHFSLSFVRRGSFGYESQGRRHELVPGATLVGHAGREFRCTHEHHLAGDECLSFHLSDGLAEAMGASRAGASLATLPPIAQLAVLGEVAQLTAEGATDLDLEEAALAYAARFVALVTGETERRARASPRDRRRAVEAALRLAERPSEPHGLEALSAGSGLSPFHFLRLFRAVTGVTPHQFLLRCRLRHAARLLAAGKPVTDAAGESGFGDLSHFVRTFRRAAGVTPGAFARATRRERRIAQERLPRAG